MSRTEQKRATAQRALERAVEEETASIRAELKAKDAEVKALHAVLSKIAGIAFGVAGNVVAAPTAEIVKQALPASIAAASTPEEPIWHEQPIDLAADDDMGPGRFV